MAWTWPTALFFVCIGLILIFMTLIEIYRPGGAPRKGFLRLTTTRGDRLFISLLGSAFIHLLWLGAFSGWLVGAGLLALVYTFCIFRWG